MIMFESTFSHKMNEMLYEMSICEYERTNNVKMCRICPRGYIAISSRGLCNSSFFHLLTKNVCIVRSLPAFVASSLVGQILYSISQGWRILNKKNVEVSSATAGPPPYNTSNSLNDEVTREMYDSREETLFILQSVAKLVSVSSL